VLALAAEGAIERWLGHRVPPPFHDDVRIAHLTAKFGRIILFTSV
jgi:hypothetical protein